MCQPITGPDNLADVFYLPDVNDPQAIYAQGIYLNQQLLDKGLAKPWKP